MAKDSDVSQSGDRSSLVAVVKTPIAWFTLVVLVAEGILVLMVDKADSAERTLAIGGMLLVLLLLIGVVAFLAYYRPEVLNLQSEALAANARFFRAVDGPWWEKVNHKDGSALSFFTITGDPMTGNVVLEGTSYGRDGKSCAAWQSEMARSYPGDRRIAYVWRGKHPLPGVAQLDFHGYGTMEFQPRTHSSTQFIGGRGDFWDVNETRPGNTVFKPAELRRVLDETHKRIMTSGSTKEKEDVVLKVIGAW